MLSPHTNQKHARFQSGVLINYQVIVRLSVKMAIIIWLGKRLVGEKSTGEIIE